MVSRQKIDVFEFQRFAGPGGCACQVVEGRAGEQGQR